MATSRKAPFFILGSPRSGTTILRDLLRGHPNLASPEESHFYRWPYAFKAPHFGHLAKKNADLVRHRAIDGVSEPEFEAIYRRATTRRELQDFYMELFLEKIGKPDARWYDKTPQNVYGAFLLHADYPEAKFIHIHRNPLNVIASLREGQVMPQQDIDAAINWWTDAAKIMESFRRVAGEVILDVRYDRLMREPRAGLAEIFDFVGEGETPFEADCSMLRGEGTRFREQMTEAEIRAVLDRCADLMAPLGYPTDVDVYMDGGEAGSDA